MLLFHYHCVQWSRQHTVYCLQSLDYLLSLLGNEATKLENALKGAWQVADYWKSSHSYIANLKNAVVKIIDDVYKDHSG